MIDLTSDNNHRVPVVKDFWYKTEDEPDPTLYLDQLGWTVPLQVESGGYTDTHDVWKNLMERTSPDIVGWDLCFYYPPTDTYYYHRRARTKYIFMSYALRRLSQK